MVKTCERLKISGSCFIVQLSTEVEQLYPVLFQELSRHFGISKENTITCRSTNFSHMDASTPNAFIQEQSLGIHYNQGSDLLDYLKDPTVFNYKNGVVSMPDKPGLGIGVNEELVMEKAKYGHYWKNPVWRNADGTIAEW